MPYKDPDKQKEYQRRWSKENRVTVNKRSREWKAKNREQMRNYGISYNKILVLKVQDFLGGKCVYCGCDVPEALEINHVNGGGSQTDMKGSRSKYYHSILKGERSKDEFELTCRVCNNWHYLTKLKGIPDGWTIIWEKQKT